MSFEVTEFRPGRATAAPPSARTRAITATTSAGDGRPSRLYAFRIAPPPFVACRDFEPAVAIPQHPPPGRVAPAGDLSQLAACLACGRPATNPEISSASLAGWSSGT